MNKLDKYTAYRDGMKTGDWIGWKSYFSPGQLIGLPIRLWQRVRYGLNEPINHIALLVRREFGGHERNFILESTVTDEYSGLRLRLLSERLQVFRGEVFWYALRPELAVIRPCLDTVLHNVLDRMEDEQIDYDTPGCLGNMWSRSPKNDANYYCSEAGYMLLERAATLSGNNIARQYFWKANTYLKGMAPMPGDVPNLGLFEAGISILKSDEQPVTIPAGTSEV
jgi:hypothetical protein